MTLRKKTLLIIAVTLLGLLTGLYFTSRTIVLGGFVEVEQEQTQHSVDLALTTMSDDLAKMASTASDWSAWDATYEFIEDGNAAYIEENVYDDVLVNLRVNLMLFVHSSGRVVHARAVDLQEGTEAPVPESLLEIIATDDLLLRHTDTHSSITGIILLPGSPLLVASTPIVTSAGEGPTRGTLILGRYLDAAELEHLATTTGLSLSIRRFDDPAVPPDFEKPIASQTDESPVVVRALDSDTIAGYAQVEDIFGNAAIVLRVDMPRNVYAQGEATIQYFMVALLAVGAVFGVVIMGLLEKTVLSRLARLRADVRKIGATSDLAARVSVPGRDELSDLGRAINGTLKSLERSWAERQRAEEALRESEERFRTLAETAAAAIFIFRGTRIRYANAAAEAITGYTRQEWLEMNFWDVIHPDYRELVRERGIGRQQGKGVPSQYEAKLLTKEGEERWVDFTAGAIQVDGKPAVVGTAFDISERKRAEEALRESETRHRTLLENLPQKIFLKDRNSVYVSCNENYARDLNIRPDEITGKTDYDFFPKELAEKYRQDDKRVMDCSKTEDIEEEYVRDGQRAYVQTVKTPLRDEDGHVVGILGIFWDISERKRAEEALRRANQQLAKDRREIEALNRSLEARVRERTRELRLANEGLRERSHQLLDARAQAATDALTGLWNHRAFHERIKGEVSRAREASSPLGLIMMDVDNFKRINDSLGHQAGDNVLRALAHTLAALAPRQHTYRYGGDEFAVLLSKADGRKTARVAERLRRAVEKRTDGNGNYVTVSLGIASLPEMAESVEELVYGADAAMYWAKSAGKNRVGDWSNLLTYRADGTLPWYAADRGVRAPDVVAALIAALAAKDPATASHTERCSWYALKLAEELGLPEEETSVVRLASLLHDIGKLAVPDEVLFKPGPLNEEEWALMKQHPAAAVHVLSHIRSLTDATPAILHHHEHLDGSGYPDGLAGEDIPIASRILLVTDAFDAMTTDRPYRKAIPVEAAIEELQRNTGSQFDPAVVDAFLAVLAREGPQPLRTKTAARARPVTAGVSGEGRACTAGSAAGDTQRHTESTS